MNLKEKTLLFRFRLVHILGKKHFTVDVMSQYATGDLDPEIMNLPDNCHMASIEWPMADKFTEMEEGQIRAGAATLDRIESVTWSHI
jgi:hypothetical protein